MRLPSYIKKEVESFWSNKGDQEGEHGIKGVEGEGKKKLKVVEQVVTLPQSFVTNPRFDRLVKALASLNDEQLCHVLQYSESITNNPSHD